MVLKKNPRERERQVEQIIKRHPEALDSYVALILWYWVDSNEGFSYDPKEASFTVHTWNVYRLSSPEAISRALRRVIEGKVKRTGVDKDEWRVREEEKYRLAYSKRNE